jgi:hypothetical protein
MAEENVAKAPNEEIPVEEPAGLYDADEIADAFLAAGSEAEPESEAKQEDAPAVEGQEQPAGEEQEAAAPDPVMPEGWEEAMWQAATPEMRAKVAEQATAHAAELAAERKAMADLKAQQEQFAIQANAQLQQALTTMQQVIEGEFRQVDWQNLAQTDPASYVQLQQMYNSRIAAVQQIQQGIARQVQVYQQQRAQEEAQRLHSEFNTVLPEIKAMVGAGFEGKKFAAEVADYLAKQGFPAEAINGISRGHELKTAVKAMLYDKLSAQRAKAAAKVAEAPKVSQPRGTAKDTSGSDRLKKAMSYLAKNPNSTDAAAAVFENL